MNFTLLRIDALVISLLWVAMGAAWAGRVKRRWVRNSLLTVIFVVPMAVLTAFAVSTAAMKFSLKIEPNGFFYAVSLLAASLVGAVLILRRASGREPGLPSRAAAWRRGPLMFAWLTAVAVGYMTLINMDLAIQARCAILSVQFNSIYLATLPAITSDQQNAAPIYEQAFALLAADQKEEEKVENPPTGDRENFDPDEPATIAFLAKEVRALALLRRAAALPGCRFDSDLVNPEIDAMMTELADSRNAANVLRLHASEEIAHGHVASAIDDAAAILGMSRHFGRRPLIISGLVGIGIDAIGNKVIEEALPSVKHKDELAGLRLDELQPLGRVFQQSLRGEESFGVTLYGQWAGEKTAAWQTGSVQGIVFQALSRGQLEGIFSRAFLFDLDAYLKFMANLQDSVTKPYWMARGQVSHVFGLDHGGGLLTSILGPSMLRGYQSVNLGEANDACAHVAVAMTLFRLDHGQFPSHLEELVPTYLDAIPIDPFDGKPLRLAIRNGEWIIYSVGVDGIDDGGVKTVNGKGDSIFTLKVVGTGAASRP